MPHSAAMTALWLAEVQAASPASQQPWWEALRLVFWSWQPVVIFGVNFLSIVIAVAAFVRAGRTDKRSKLRTRIFEKIAHIRATSERAAAMVEANLLGEAVDQMRLNKAHLPISIVLKQLEIRIAEFEHALPCKKDVIFRAFNAWKQALTGDGYPVQRKDDAFKKGEPRVANVAIAQTTFSSILSEIEDGCIHEKIKFWA